MMPCSMRGIQQEPPPRAAGALALLGVAAAALGGAACDRAPAPDADPGSGDAAVVDSPGIEPGAADSAGPAAPDRPAASDTGPGAVGVEPSSPGRLTGFDTVYAYFTAPDEEQVPVPRAVADTAHGLRAAFTALLAGPTAEERAAGLRSWFSRETAGMLRGVEVADGFAVIDFEDLRPVIPNAVGSAGALMLLGELQATAFQFAGVRRVEFRIEGSCEALMAWLQFGCYPIRRGGWDPPPGFREAVR